MSDDQELLEKVKKKVDDTYASLASLWSSHTMLKSNSQDSFNECITKIANSNSQASQKVTELTEKAKADTQKLSEQASRINALCINHTAAIKSIQDSLIRITAQYEDLRVVIKDVENRIRPAVDKAVESMMNKIVSTKKEVTDKIDALAIPKDAVNIDQVKAQISQQIEPAALDARNSLLSMRNHEIRLTVAEKKVEGLMLQMRNMELDK